MGRMPRIQVEGAIYYLTPECSRNSLIFRDSKDYAMYMALLSKHRNKYNFKLFAFCFTPNNISLLIEPSDTATISQMMHDLIPSYTKYFNGKYKRKGRLFQKRYRMVLIEKEPNLLKMTAYIHLMPKFMRLAKKLSS
jgi:REP element-mobilizing transposase RayT